MLQTGQKGELGLPPTQSLAFVQGRGSQRRMGTLYPKEAGFLRPWEPYTPQTIDCGSPVQSVLLLA